MRNLFILCCAAALTGLSSAVAQAQEREWIAKTRYDAPSVRLSDLRSIETSPVKKFSQGRIEAKTASGGAAASGSMAEWRSPKKAARKASIDDLTGQRTLIAHPTTGLLVTDTVTVEKADDGSLLLKGFLIDDISLTATVDEVSGKLSIAPQHVIDVSGSPVSLCCMDVDKGVYSETDTLTATIDGGNIYIGSGFGFFVTSGSQKGSYLTVGLMEYADIIAASNGTVTNSVITFANNTLTTANRSVADETDWVFVRQLSDSKARVSHIPTANGYIDMNLTLGYDNTVEIDPQTVFTTTSYSFCNYSMTETTASSGSITISASLLSPIKGTMATGDAAATVSWNKWMIGAISASKFADLFESTTLSTTADLTIPAKPQADFEGEGTEASPYLIKTMADLATLSAVANTDTSVRDAKVTPADTDKDPYYPVFKGKYFRLENDLDASDYNSEIDPICVSGLRFAGVFDGNGHTISNFKWKDYAYDYLGLFGIIDETGVVKNLSMASPTFTSQGYVVGSLAGECFGQIDNCHVTGGIVKATAGYHAGGLAGRTHGTVSNSSFTGGKITALGYIGGITGKATADIIGCHAGAAITMNGKQMFAGGIAGFAMPDSADTRVSITRCYFTGSLSSSQTQIALGGIAGESAKVDISQCFVSARILGAMPTSNYLGGLVGTVYATTVNDCYAAGQVSNSQSINVGALTGHSTETESTYAGGSTFTNCYSSMQITSASDDSMGALIGDQNFITLSNCCYDRQLSPFDYTAGLLTRQLTTAAGLSGFSSDVWTFTEGLYPRITAIADNDAAYVSVSAVTLSDADDVSLVSKDFTYSTQNGVTWASYQGGKTDTAAGNAFTFSNGTAVLNGVIQSDTLVVSGGGVSKYFFLSIAPIPFSGSGTAQDPWLISTKADLEAFSTMSNDASLTFKGKYLRMTADIDMQGADFTPISKDTYGNKMFMGNFDGDGHTIDNMNVTTVAFYGEGETKAGQVNPKSDDTYNNNGLFGNIGADGSVSNLAIGSGCKFETFCRAGAVAGKCSGTITNCRNYADLRCYYGYAGGIVGQLNDSGVISGCLNAGNVYSGSLVAGGIVGDMTAGTAVTECANTGEVGAIYLNDYKAAGSQNSAGGIAGSNTKGTITNVMNTGYVTAYKKVGGIVGSLTGTSAAPATVTNAVNYGFLTSLSDVATSGAIAGDNSGGTVATSFFDKQLIRSGAVNNGSNAAVKPLLTSELTAGSLALPDSAWTQTAGRYPVLTSAADEPEARLASMATVTFDSRDNISYVHTTAALGNTASVTYSLKKATAFSISGSELAVSVPSEGVEQDTIVAKMDAVERLTPVQTLNASVLEGSGTQADPYRISTADDMLTLSSFVGSTGYDYEGCYFTVLADLDFTGKTYSPVSGDANVFNADFNGNGHTISNIAYDATTATTTDVCGLFGSVGVSGYVHDIVLDATNSFKGKNKIGSVAGNMYGSVSGCTTAATVTATTSYAGGIAGYAYSGASFVKCANSGTVTATTSYAGGILGASAAAAGLTVDSCSNAGDVTTGQYCGGIIGSASASVTGCSNTGSITASKKWGAGIVGKALYPSLIKGADNSGSITGLTYVAGIVAEGEAHTNATPLLIDSCRNTADINPSYNKKSSGYAGGIAGVLAAGSHVTACSNSGVIYAAVTTEGRYYGGIAGSLKGSSSGKSYVWNSVNTGDIKGLNNIGGIIGVADGDGGTIEARRCVNSGDVASSNASISYAGGILGNGDLYVYDCLNMGNITGTGKGAAGIAGYLSGAAYAFERNVNLGDVTVTSSKGLNVGGMVGWGRPYMYDCYNFGTITGYDGVGGLVGTYGNTVSSKYDTRLNRSYNAGKVVASTSNVGNICAVNENGTVTIDSCFYDTTVNGELGADASFSEVKGLTHNEMLDLDLGSAFVKATATYPSLTALADSATHNFYAATYRLKDGDELDNVTADFLVGTPVGVSWSSSDNIAVSGNNVAVNNTVKGETATLTLTAAGMERTISLILNKDKSLSVGSASAGGKSVQSRATYNAAGVRMSGTGKGVMIERSVYSDGTVKTVKKVAVKR